MSSNPVQFPILRPSVGWSFAGLLAHQITGPAAPAAPPPSSGVAASPFARADPGGSGTPFPVIGGAVR